MIQPVPDGWAVLPSGDITWRFWCQKHGADLEYEPSETPTLRPEQTEYVNGNDDDNYHRGYLAGTPWNVDWGMSAGCPGLLKEGLVLPEDQQETYWDENDCSDDWRILQKEAHV